MDTTLSNLSFAGGSDGQPSNPITITPPGVDTLRSLCATEHRKGGQSQACIFHGLELPAGHAGKLTVDFLGGAMPSSVEVQADQPRNIGGKRKTYGGTAKKHKRAKMDKLPLEAADTTKPPDSSTFQGIMLNEHACVTSRCGHIPEYGNANYFMLLDCVHLFVY